MATPRPQWQLFPTIIKTTWATKTNSRSTRNHGRRRKRDATRTHRIQSQRAHPQTRTESRDACSRSADEQRSNRSARVSGPTADSYGGDDEFDSRQRAREFTQPRHVLRLSRLEWAPRRRSARRPCDVDGNRFG